MRPSGRDFVSFRVILNVCDSLTRFTVLNREEGTKKILKYSMKTFLSSSMCVSSWAMVISSAGKGPIIMKIWIMGDGWLPSTLIGTNTYGSPSQRIQPEAAVIAN